MCEPMFAYDVSSKRFRAARSAGVSCTPKRVPMATRRICVKYAVAGAPCPLHRNRNRLPPDDLLLVTRSATARPTARLPCERLTGSGAVVAHQLWELAVGGSNPPSPTVAMSRDIVDRSLRT